MPRRTLIAVVSVCVFSTGFSAVTGFAGNRLSDLEQFMVPASCLAFICILLLSIRGASRHFRLVSNLVKIVGGANLLTGTIDGLMLQHSNIFMYISWLPVYYAATFYISDRSNGFYWSLSFLGIFIALVVAGSILGPLPLDHPSIILLYFSIFPQFTCIIIVHYISVFREDLATERTRTRLLRDNAAALQAESESAERARQEAAASDRAKSIFLANMSHELRTPLNAIIGFAQMTEHGLRGPLSTPYREYAADIRASADMLLDRINDILEVSRIELGEATMREEIVDLADLIISCTRLVRHRALERHVTITFDPPRSAMDSPRLRVDAGKMKQVVTNVLYNGVKFNRVGGKLHVTLDQPPGGDIVIRFTDTGIGMRPDEIDRAMDLFHQADNGFIRRYQGVGLGLSIARSLMDLHGGSIRIESTVGEGTTVELSLPAARRVAADRNPDDTGLDNTGSDGSAQDNRGPDNSGHERSLDSSR